eukprot:3859424-Lingulodinium_polyedra.AAC.1
MPARVRGHGRRCGRVAARVQKRCGRGVGVSLVRHGSVTSRGWLRSLRWAQVAYRGFGLAAGGTA